MKHETLFNLNGKGSGIDLSKPVSPMVVSQLAGLVQNLAAQPRTLRTLALVSSCIGEGTSTALLNFGRYLAESRHAKVLIVDANQHRPALHTLTGLEQAAGLLELLNGEIGFDAAIKETSLPNLFVLTSGVRTPLGTNGLVQPSAFRERVLDCTAAFDFVLVDCPAVNVKEDAATTAALCDGVILVVEGGRTQRKAAQAAKRLLTRANCRILGVFMNKRKFYIPKFVYDRL